MSASVPEQYTVVQALRPGTTMNTASTGDWVDARKFHSITAIINVARPAAAPIYAEWYSASDSAGTGAAALTTGVKWWKLDGPTTAYRMTPTTSSPSSHTVASATGLYQLVGQFDPARLPSSDPWVACAVRNSSQATDFVSMTYLGLARQLPGYEVVATTSST